MQMKEKENNKVNAQEDIEEEFENVGTYINPSMNVDFWEKFLIIHFLLF